jgi:hypothetical protein
MTVINPYMEVIQILGETLEVFNFIFRFILIIFILMIRFDDDHIIPAFGFGDTYTQFFYDY